MRAEEKEVSKHGCKASTGMAWEQIVGVAGWSSEAGLEPVRKQLVRQVGHVRPTPTLERMPSGSFTHVILHYYNHTIQSISYISTDTGTVTVIPSSHSIMLHHNLGTKMYYLCNLTDAKSLPLSPVEVNKNVTNQSTTVTGLLPDTTYRVDSVAYRSDGVEACLEVNTTVTTCG